MSVVVDGQRSTSIRVSVGTRDALAEQARALGLSLSSYLDQAAGVLARQQAYARHRAVVEAEAALPDPVWRQDLALWAETDLDGLE